MRICLVVLFVTITLAACSTATPASTSDAFVDFSEADARVVLVAEVNKVCVDGAEGSLTSGINLAKGAEAAQDVDHWRFVALDPLGGIYLANVYKSGEIGGSLIPAITRRCEEGVGTSGRITTE